MPWIVEEATLDVHLRRRHEKSIGQAVAIPRVNGYVLGGGEK